MLYLFTISGSSNLDNCFYLWLILALILHLKVLFNLLLLLFIIYIINLPVVRPRSCRVIYYFDTPTPGIRHQSFDRIISYILFTKYFNMISLFVLLYIIKIIELKIFICMCRTIFLKKYHLKVLFVNGWDLG